MSRKRKAIGAGAVLAFLGGAITLGMQVDRYLLERRQIVAQMAFDAAVRECELEGGAWWRGTCEHGSD